MPRLSDDDASTIAAQHQCASRTTTWRQTTKELHLTIHSCAVEGSNGQSPVSYNKNIHSFDLFEPVVLIGIGPVGIPLWFRTEIVTLQ